jgi:hypothetical protein
MRNLGKLHAFWKSLLDVDEESASRASRFSPKEFHLHWPQSAVAKINVPPTAGNRTPVSNIDQYAVWAGSELWRSAGTADILIYLLVSYAWIVSTKHSDFRSFTRSSLLIIQGHVQSHRERLTWRNKTNYGKNRENHYWSWVSFVFVIFKCLRVDFIAVQRNPSWLFSLCVSQTCTNYNWARQVESSLQCTVC